MHSISTMSKFTPMLIIYSCLSLPLLMASSTTTTSAPITTYYRVAYSTDSFITHTLGNPCVAEPPSDPELHDQPVLRVEGRRHVVREQANHVLRLLGQLDHLPLSNCMGMRLQSLPATGLNTSDALSSDTLSQLYQAIFHLGAHFKFMQSDWREGRSCHRHPHQLIDRLDELVNSLQQLMCLLLVSSDPHPFSAPYPSTSMLAEHESSKRHEVYRFHDCTGRMIRDCVLISSATDLIKAVVKQ